MRVFTLLITFLLLSCSSTKSTDNQNIVTTDKTVADFYIKFNSICCGPTSYQPWLIYTDKFLNQQNIQFNLIEKVSNLGREGEFMILLFTKDWSENQKQQYFNGLQKIEWENQNDNNFGGVEVGMNYPTKKINDFPNAAIEDLDLEYW